MGLTLKELFDYVNTLHDGMFPYSLGEPFSWRGSYDEVAFSIRNVPATKEELLNTIKAAYDNKFYGYKGGEFTYQDHTFVHFEANAGDYTDGGYTSNWIAQIEGVKTYRSQEERLVNLMFKS